jgi:hypothetical protein
MVDTMLTVLDLLCMLAYLYRGYPSLYRKIHPVRLPHLWRLHVRLARDRGCDAMWP